MEGLLEIFDGLTKDILSSERIRGQVIAVQISAEIQKFLMAQDEMVMGAFAEIFPTAGDAAVAYMKESLVGIVT